MIRRSLQSVDRRTANATGASIPQARTAVRVQRRPRAWQYARKLSTLKRFEWLLLLQISSLLCSLLMTYRSVPMQILMEKFDAEPDPPGTLRVRPGRLAYLVTGFMRFTLRDRYCMKRSILIFHFLRRWGHSASVFFGVVKEDGALQGHAWVELDGRPFAEAGDPRLRYTVTYVYPSGHASRTASYVTSPLSAG